MGRHWYTCQYNARVITRPTCSSPWGGGGGGGHLPFLAILLYYCPLGNSPHPTPLLRYNGTSKCTTFCCVSQNDTWTGTCTYGNHVCKKHKACNPLKSLTSRCHIIEDIIAIPVHSQQTMCATVCKIKMQTT